MFCKLKIDFNIPDDLSDIIDVVHNVLGSCYNVQIQKP